MQQPWHGSTAMGSFWSIVRTHVDALTHPAMKHAQAQPCKLQAQLERALQQRTELGTASSSSSNSSSISSSSSAASACGLGGKAQHGVDMRPRRSGERRQQWRQLRRRQTSQRPAHLCRCRDDGLPAVEVQRACGRPGGGLLPGAGGAHGLRGGGGAGALLAVHEAPNYTNSTQAVAAHHGGPGCGAGEHQGAAHSAASVSNICGSE